MKHIKPISLVLSVLLLICSFVTLSPDAYAASGPSVKTTLTDGAVQRGSKKTFDVWAKNSAGNKIKATVKLNGAKVEPTWDDTEKTSYTLTFTKEGENTVSVSAVSDGGKKKELTYRITYKKASQGEKIGKAVWSIEAFTVGGGYIVYPVEVPIYEGETAAQQLLSLLHSKGFVAYYGGKTTDSFYLAYIADGTATAQRYNAYALSGKPQSQKKLNITPKIPDLLDPYLKSTMTFYDPDDYENWKGYLGEFAFTNGSGWMYSVNNVFPNVGFADCYLSDGDTVRVQYTLAYGADIGGFGAVGDIPNTDNQPTGGYYTVANKDALTRAVFSARSSGLLSRTNVKAAYESALAVAATLNASQSAVDGSVNSLNTAVSNPAPESQAPTATPEQKPSASADTDKIKADTQTKPSETTVPTAEVTQEAPCPDTTADTKKNDAVKDESVTEVETKIAQTEEKAPASDEKDDLKKPFEKDEKPEKKKNNTLGVILIISAALLLAGGGIVTFILIKRKGKKND